MKKIKNDILGKILEFIIKYQKYVYPVLALVAAAIVVVVVLNIQKRMDENSETTNVNVSINDSLVITGDDVNAPLAVSSDEMLMDLLNTYYECLSNGDTVKLASLCDTVDESELYKFEEQSKYLGYKINEVFTQDGPSDGTYVAYVYSYVIFDEYPELNFPAYRGFYIKTSEEGSMFIVNGELTEEENAYIDVVKNQDDVIELNNKVNVEYNEVVLENPYILEYLVQLDTVISTAVGERIAELNASQVDEGTETGNGNGSELGDIPLDNQTLYATALTSVNVRKSDSAESERLGEVSQGQRLEVVEVLINGWTKVIYEGQEAFIKSEYLSLIQSAEGVSTIGMMTALDNVNIRSSASTDSEVLGALVTGDQYEIAAIENGWVTIKFDGILAYVSAEYCECTMF